MILLNAEYVAEDDKIIFNERKEKLVNSYPDETHSFFYLACGRGNPDQSFKDIFIIYHGIKLRLTFEIISKFNFGDKLEKLFYQYRINYSIATYRPDENKDEAFLRFVTKSCY